MTIDLVQWLDPPPAGQAYPTLANVGLTRLAFRVADIDRTAAGLRAAGVKSLSDAVQEFGRGVRSIALKDPDGNRRTDGCVIISVMPRSSIRTRKEGSGWVPTTSSP